MIVFSGLGLRAVVDSADGLHPVALGAFREAVNGGEAWTTSLALAELDRQIVHLDIGTRRDVLNQALAGIEIVWVGPELLRRSVDSMSSEETVERATARAVAAALGGRCFPP